MSGRTFSPFCLEHAGPRRRVCFWIPTSFFFDLPQEGNIPEWSRLLEQKLAEKGLVVGYLGTEGDEYTVFFTTWKELALLERCASSIHQVISAVH